MHERGSTKEVAYAQGGLFHLNSVYGSIHSRVHSLGLSISQQSPCTVPVNAATDSYSDDCRSKASLYRHEDV